MVIGIAKFCMIPQEVAVTSFNTLQSFSWMDSAKLSETLVNIATQANAEVEP
jgi:hypothetical protein